MTKNIPQRRFSSRSRGPVVRKRESGMLEKEQKQPRLETLQIGERIPRKVTENLCRQHSQHKH